MFPQFHYQELTFWVNFDHLCKYRLVPDHRLACAYTECQGYNYRRTNQNRTVRW